MYMATIVENAEKQNGCSRWRLPDTAVDGNSGVLLGGDHKLGRGQQPSGRPGNRTTAP